MPDEIAANDELLDDIIKLFEDDKETESQPVKVEEKLDYKPADPMTKNVSERINKERENIAKQMGFASYAEMLKSKETKLIEEKGYDPKEIGQIVNEIVEQRLAQDSRLQELENYKQKQIEEFAKKELEGIKKLTNGEVDSIDKLSKEVMDLWAKTGNLKQAFLACEGEKYIEKFQKMKPDTKSHLQPVKGAPSVPQVEMRPLTEQEKKVWKQAFPNMTQEELNKKMTKK